MWYEEKAFCSSHSTMMFHRDSSQWYRVPYFVVFKCCSVVPCSVYNSMPLLVTNNSCGCSPTQCTASMRTLLRPCSTRHERVSATSPVARSNILTTRCAIVTARCDRDGDRHAPLMRSRCGGDEDDGGEDVDDGAPAAAAAAPVVGVDTAGHSVSASMLSLYVVHARVPLSLTRM
jgi:hypothetical protein